METVAAAAAFTSVFPGRRSSTNLKRSPNATDFVVSTDDREAAPSLQSYLAEFGHVEPLEGHAGKFVVTLDGDPKEAAGRLHKALKRFKSDVHVEPILVDERGNPVVPTGKVSVRFNTSPSTDELHRFAAPLGLTVDSRNDYIPSQVTFRVADMARRSVIDMVEKIQKHAVDVQRVWPETLGVYRRG